MKIIAIGGNPGSGKSTLMKRIIEHCGVEPKYNQYKLVPYLQKDNIYILGKYEEGEVFSGTDRMSMAVQPEAIKFLASLPKESIILFEGDRLFTSSFLEHCLENYELQIFHLKTNESVREERYKLRGSNQDKTWLQGRESKINNILTNMMLMFNIKSIDNNTYEEQNKVYNEILETINGG
jgi:deoxyadenosine/deoxycytidine kinase